MSPGLGSLTDRVLTTARLLGIDVGAVLRAPATLRELRQVGRERRRFEAESRRSGLRTAYPLGRPRPMLGERGASAGSGSGHYFHQDLYVGRAIAAAQPKVHVDVGGRVDGFVAHVATFRSLYYVDLRPFPEPVSGVTDVQADITSEASVRALVDRGVLPPADSLSFLHTIEHIGLGRYGDTIDPAGHVKALTNLMRLLRPGGTLYLSTPIGPGRVEFNAHRVFHPADIEELLDTTGLTVMRRALVDDTGRMVGEVGETGLADAVEAGLVHGLGIWTAVRRDDPGPLSPAAG